MLNEEVLDRIEVPDRKNIQGKTAEKERWQSFRESQLEDKNLKVIIDYIEKGELPVESEVAQKLVLERAVLAMTSFKEHFARLCQLAG